MVSHDKRSRSRTGVTIGLAWGGLRPVRASSTRRGMSVRKFRKEDREELIELWRDVFPDDPPHNDPPEVLTAKLAVDDLVFVATADSRVVGACLAGYDGHRGWLYAVAVSPEHRRRGLGRQLVLAAVEALRDLGCVKVNLQIRASNREVEAFYRSLGFAVEERISMGLLLN